MELLKDAKATECYGEKMVGFWIRPTSFNLPSYRLKLHKLGLRVILFNLTKIIRWTAAMSLD